MYSYYTVQIIASQAFSGFGVRESCSRFYAVMGTGKANVKSPEVAHCGVEWSYLDTVKAAARPLHSKLFQFADPNVAIADWMIVILQGQGELFRPGDVRRAHVVAGRAC